MSDEEDFFGSSQKEIRPRTEVPRCVAQTQIRKSDVTYLWLILFQHDIENKAPFSVFNRSLFSFQDIPESWYLFKLRNDLRTEKIYLRVLNGTYSVFCKIEDGTLKSSIVIEFKI